MADIFLSYAHEDIDRARQLAEALGARGWSVWWDRRIPHGKDFNAYIEQQLSAARCIIVLWSKAALASKFVRDALERELPQHHVTLPAFFMGRYEVTVAQFRACVSDGGCTPGDRQALDAPDDLPVRYVSWHEALAYCRWLDGKLKSSDRTPSALADVLTGRRDGQPWQITLPSEAEWERAARGTDGRIYPWGGQIHPSRANYHKAKPDGPTPVGSFPTGASPEGLLDMSGNVWEWTRSLWGKDPKQSSHGYPYNPSDPARENLEAPDDVVRVLRGGAFVSNADDLRAANRGGFWPQYRGEYVGFRVVSFRCRS